VTGQAWEFNDGTYTAVLLSAAAANGSLLWTMPLPGTVITDMTVPDWAEEVIVATGDGVVRAVASATGSLVWALPVLKSSGPNAAAGSVRLTVSPDGTQAVVYNGTAAAAIDLQNQTVLWMAGAGSLAGACTGRYSWDAATGLLLCPNNANAFAVNGTTGALAWSTSYPLAVAPGALAIGVAPANVPYFFVYTSLAGTGGTSPVVYAFSTATGTVVALYTWNPSQYAQWGQVMVTDASGLVLYVPVLGPLAGDSDADDRDAAVPAPDARHRDAGRAGASPASAAATARRQLQGGGSVYLSVLTFNPATTSLTQTSLTLLPALLQGFVELAPGPANGQLAVASGGRAAVLTA
jgi:hypothetical protein